MSQQRVMQRLAIVLRKYPWTVVAARHVWRWSRPKFSMGVVGVVFNESGQVLFVEHVFHPYLPWGLPGGWVERREDPAITVQRELREELGMEVEVGPVVALKTEGQHVDLAYLCYPRSPVMALSYELLDYRWLDPTELPRTHGFHCIAVQRAWHLLAFEANS
jgi:8-oxo-dGTP diphosphatase